MEDHVSIEGTGMQVLGVSWKTRGTKYKSGLNVRNSQDEIKFLPITRGQRIAWTVQGPKRCIGRLSDDQILNPCPSKQVVLKGAKCPECSALDFFEPCIRCNGYSCRASNNRRIECENSDYVVYLAIFNDSSIKVGVSTKKRAMIRWLEQGADYAGVLLEVEGGKMARQIEHDIGRHPAIQTAVSSASKKKSLLSKLSFDEANSIVMSFLDSYSIHSTFEAPTLIDLSIHYSLDDLLTEPIPWLRRNQKIQNLKLVGNVLGMKGSYLITKIGNAYRIASLKRLIGYSINEGIAEPFESQSGLLDFI